MTEMSLPAIATHVLHRHLRTVPPRAVSGEGVYLVDAQGRRYLDACGGAAVSCLGHGHPEVLAAMHRQIDQLAYAHTSFFTTEVAETLADQLVRTAPPGMSHVYFVSGGSEAMEAAMKLARQYFVETGEPERRHFIARKQSYHGNTLGVLAVGGNAWRRAPFAPRLDEATQVSPCGAGGECASKRVRSTCRNWVPSAIAWWMVTQRNARRDPVRPARTRSSRHNGRLRSSGVMSTRAAASRTASGI